MNIFQLPRQSRFSWDRPGRLLAALLFLFSLTLAACGGLPDLPGVQDSRDDATPTLPPTAAPTSTAVPSGSEGVGLTFYRAWEAKDYLGMYSLLSPQSQALIDSQAFVTRYEDVMSTATVDTILVQPLSARQEGNRAELTVRVTWNTQVVGTIIRENTAELAYSDGRWGIVWNEGLILPELDGGFRLQMNYRIPARANIYDRNGLALAYQGTAITLGVVPGRIVDETALLNTLSPILGRPVEDIKALYAEALPDWYVPLGDVTSAVIQENFEALSPFLESTELVTEERLTRLYTETGIAPHLVGYTAPIPAEQLDFYQSQGYRGDEYVGAAALEAWGEHYLSGQRGGELWLVKSSGEYVATIQENAPRQARSLYTTIDREFQAAVETALAQAVSSHPLGQHAAVVILDVNTGSVLAMASYPDYNPIIFDSLRPYADSALGQVLSDPDRPLVNRAAQGEYPAGSVFKVITTAAALDSGLYNANTLFTCTGRWTGLGSDFVLLDWLTTGHGTITLGQALTRSCNPYNYQMGFDLDAFDPFFLPNMARQFGLGAPTGIEGIPEVSGLVPDPDWKITNLGDGWARGDAVNMAIGQGFILVTPLQIANMMAAVANGGTLYQPRLIDRVGSGGGAPEENWPVTVIHDIDLAPASWDLIHNSLTDVASGNFGTATATLANFQVPTAGKTGTAQNAASEPHAWFAGYAPATPYTRPDGTVINAPEIAIAVIVENAGEGSAVAAPIFRRMVELYYGITPQAPLPWGP